MNISNINDDLSNFPSYGAGNVGGGEVMDRMMATGPIDREPSAFPVKINKVAPKKNDPSEHKLMDDDDLLKLTETKDDVDDANAEKKKRRKKKWKKPKDKPNRPLSAYNLFFRHQRAVMLGPDAPTREEEKLKKRVHCKTHGKIGFAEMAKEIGSRWKTLDPDTKRFYEMQAQKEKQRYSAELAAWKQAQKFKGDGDDESQGFGAIAAAGLMGRNPMEAGGAAGSANLAAGMMMQDPFQRAQRQGFAPLLQQRQPQDMSLEYLRALQGQQLQMEQNTRMGARPRLDAQLGMDYPNAAEASANAIMQQFQGFQPTNEMNSAPQQQQQDLLRAAPRDFDRFQQFSMMNPNMNMAAMSAMRQLQAQQQRLGGGGPNDHNFSGAGGNDFSRRLNDFSFRGPNP